MSLIRSERRVFDVNYSISPFAFRSSKNARDWSINHLSGGRSRRENGQCPKASSKGSPCMIDVHCLELRETRKTPSRLAMSDCNDFGKKGRIFMGGYNSGSNQLRSRYGRVDRAVSLDTRALHRAGWLKPGKWGSYRPNLNLLAKEGQLTLIYDASFEDGSQRSIGETFDVVYSPRHFGGKVPYLVCPGRGCGRRVTMLYRSSGRFRCRKCSKLVYDCQYESFVDRAARRFNKINGKLGINEGNAGRPKYMRRRTYHKLLCQLQSIEDSCGS